MENHYIRDTNRGARYDVPASPHSNLQAYDQPQESKSSYIITPSTNTVRMSYPGGVATPSYQYSDQPDEKESMASLRRPVNEGGLTSL
jgi:hypothetical protein